MAMQRWERYSVDSLARGEDDPKGKIFLSACGQQILDRVRILHAGVDTVRQLYAGTPRLALFDQIIERYQEGRGSTITLFGTLWAVGAGSTGSGYRYRLQNNALGVIVFLGARHSKMDGLGNHLKIELSPHFIIERTPEAVQVYLDGIAKNLLEHVEPVGVAVHLALDVQGWEPPSDFMPRFVTRSKKIMRIDGIQTLEFNHSEIATTYGKGETYMFGTASALQCCIYNKAKQAHARDKLDFWQGVWGCEYISEGSGDEAYPGYDSTRDVWRIEFRFHQSVLREFAQGNPYNPDTGECLDMAHGFKRFIDTVPHLTGLWRSALQTYRLDHQKNLIDATWQLLQEDARFYGHSVTCLYRRERKTPGLGNEKNVALVVGNLISLYARQGFGIRQAMAGLQQCGAWEDIREYYRRRKVSSDQLRQLIEDRLIQRRLLGRAA